LDAEAEVLLMRRPGPHPELVYVLRLWRAPVLLDDGEPLWIGTAQTMRFKRPIRGFGLWMPEPDNAGALAQLRLDLAGLRMTESSRDKSSVPVLRIRSDTIDPQSN
jgi:hypothetical protein